MSLYQAVKKTAGSFVLVRGWWSSFEVEKHYSEGDARAAAAPLWMCWIVYHEQRGCYVEIAAGGFGWAHGRIRKYVRDGMKVGMDKMYGHMGS